MPGTQGEEWFWHVAWYDREYFRATGRVRAIIVKRPLSWRR
jgi:hypothetical protein